MNLGIGLAAEDPLILGCFSFLFCASLFSFLAPSSSDVREGRKWTEDLKEILFVHSNILDHLKAS